MNVLVIDDEKDLSLIICDIIKQNGHEAEFSLKGAEGLEKVKVNRFDAVFLDIVMPGMPSRDIYEEIRKISPDTRIIIMTGKLMDNELREFISEPGIHGFVGKPFKIEELLKVMEDCNK